MLIIVKHNPNYERHIEIIIIFAAQRIIDAQRLKLNTMSHINQKHFYANYRVKVYGNGLNTLVGLPMLLSLVGDDLATRLLNRADKKGNDKEVCKLRRGLKITIYVK